MILVFGDLHFYDGIVGYHKNYEENTLMVMDSIITTVKEGLDDLDESLNEQLYVVFTMDLSGVKPSAKKFRTKNYSLKVYKFFQTLNELTNGNVYGVKGNHDFSATDLSELDYYIGLGLIRMVDYFDSRVDNTRLHLFSYGDKLQHAHLHEEFMNIAVTHHNLSMEGVKFPFYAGEPIMIEPTCLANMDMIFGGHIHYPVSTVGRTMENGKSCSLAYLGCPTRPAYDKNLWNYYYVGVVSHGDYFLHTVELPDWKDVFDLTALEDPEIYSEYGNVENEDLLKLVETLVGYDDEFYQDIGKQIEQIPGYSEEVRQLAKEYYERHTV